MEQPELQPTEVYVSATLHETALISNIIYTALKHMPTLDDDQRKEAQHFIVKLQRAALSTHLHSKQPS
jgi:hypothetical protein